MTSTLQIAFPQVTDTSKALAIPAEPAAPVATGMGQLATTTETRKTLSCKDLLVGETRANAEAEAKDMLPKMLENTQVFTVFGTDALDGVNRLVDQLLRSKRQADLPEVRALMKDLSRSMRGLGKKYDPNDPKVLAKYEKLRSGILQRLHLAKTFLDEFLDDVRSMESQFDRAVNTLSDKRAELEHSVGYYDEFYKLNEQEISKLIYKIGVMELIRDLAAIQADAITVGDAALGDRQGEAKAKLTEFVSLMETKIAAFKGRLWVAWAMSPQVRTMRTLNVGLVEKINETVTVGIPTMKSTIVLWMKMGEAEQAAQVNEAVEEIINQSMTQFAQAAAIAVPKIAEAIQSPALKPQTVVAMANSIAAQADGVIAALESGERQRAELDTAMIEGKKVIDAAVERVNDAQVEHVLELAKAAPLQIARAVPVQN